MINYLTNLSLIFIIGLYNTIVIVDYFTSHLFILSI